MRSALILTDLLLKQTSTVWSSNPIHFEARLKETVSKKDEKRMSETQTAKWTTSRHSAPARISCGQNLQFLYRHSRLCEIYWSRRDFEKVQKSLPFVATLGIQILQVEMPNLTTESDLFLELKVENQTHKTGPVVSDASFALPIRPPPF